MIVDIVFGFLGSGKTTFIGRVLKDWGNRERIVVLVNEFGEVGIDGSLLARQGGNVVEMPSGCICCTLQADFRSQMLDIIRFMKPQRLIVEPTGVATIEQIRSIVDAQLFENAVKEVHDIMIADATGFMDLYKANRHFVESQVKHAHIVLLNKCDRVDKRKARVVQSAISAINPHITVLTTEFGGVDWAEYHAALSAISARRIHGDDLEEKNRLHQAENTLGYESFGCVYRDLIFEQNAIETLFTRLADAGSGMGEIVRAKGIFRIEKGWLLVELASGEMASQPIQESQETRVSVIGKGLNRARIGASLERCVRGA
jgi:G3E family GTPase